MKYMNSDVSIEKIIEKEKEKAIGKYKKLTKRYTLNYVYSKLSSIKKYDDKVLCQLVVDRNCQSLDIAMKLIDNLKKKSFVAVFNIATLYRATNLDNSIKKLIEWVPKQTLHDIFIIESLRPTYTNRYSKLVNNYIGLPWETYGFEETCTRIHHVTTMSPEFYTFLLDNGYTINTAFKNTGMLCSIDAIKSFIITTRDAKFIEYTKKLDDKRLTSINSIIRAKTLYQLFKLDKDLYCNLFIELCDIRGGLSEPPMFLELAKIHSSNKSNIDKRKLAIKAFYNCNDPEFSTIHSKLNSNELYDYLYNTDIEGCIKYLYNKYTSNYKSIVANSLQGIRNTAAVYHYRFLSDDEYIIDMIDDFKANVFAEIDRIEQIKKEEMIPIRFEEKKRATKEVAHIFNDFIESDYTVLQKYYDDKYPSRSINNDKKNVKDYYPDVYENYINKINKYINQNYAILNNTADKLRKAIEASKYNLSLLDFCKIYTPKDMIKYFTETVHSLEYNNSRVLKNYYRKNKSLMIYYNVDVLMKEKLNIAGKDITDEDKVKILDYIKINNLPKFVKIYKELCRLYVKGEIDLSKKFNDNEE